MPEGDTAVKPLEGKTTIDDKMFFEPERLSYECAMGIAAEIVDSIIKDDSLNEATIVLASTQLLADFTNLQAALTTLDSLTRDYESIAELGIDLARRASRKKIDEGIPSSETALSFESLITAATAAIAPATALVSATLGLVSFFREDVEYHGAKTTVDSLAFEITLASHLKPKAKKVIIPDLVVDYTVLESENSLSRRLEKAQNAKSAAWKVIGPMITELARLEAELEKVARESKQSEFDRLSVAISNLRRNMQPISEPLSRCDQRLAAIQEEWNKRDESTGRSGLARMLRAENIQAANPKYLHAKVVSSGGHHRISRSLLRSIFVGDGLSFSGGTTVRWALLDEDGNFTNGGIIVKRATDSSGHGS